MEGGEGVSGCSRTGPDRILRTGKNQEPDRTGPDRSIPATWPLSFICQHSFPFSRACRPPNKLKKNNVDKVDHQKVEKKQWVKVGHQKVEKNNG